MTLFRMVYSLHYLNIQIENHDTQQTVVQPVFERVATNMTEIKLTD